MKRWATIPFFLLLGLLIGPMAAHGQGATTAAIQGEVTDANGEVLPGANVVVVHVPSGTQYGTSTNQNGRYNLTNLRVGGPYRVTVSFVGYQSQREEGVTLDLGETTRLNFQLQEQTAELEEVQVVARRGGILSSERRGVATNIRTEEIESQPTMGRRLADITRLVPQSYVANSDDDGPAVSFAGQNTDFNSISIDGAVSNDVFGLSAQGIDGGQSGASIISLSAIEEISVDVSPFTVTRSGFTGGAINMVTKSGSNQFSGSAEYYRRSANLTQSSLTVDGDELVDGLPESPVNRFVFSLGGPIVKDKLFFFVNADINRDDEGKPWLTPYQGNLSVEGDDNNELDGLKEVRRFVERNTGYDPGRPGDKVKILESNKFLGRLDYNVSTNHKLTARYYYNDNFNVDRFQSTQRFVNFSNDSEVFPNKQQNLMLQWNGSFGTQVSTQTTATVKNVEDDRGVQGEPFPSITVTDGPASFRLGSEAFSHPNFLEQTVGTFTNQTDLFFGNHTVTVGTHNEFYSIDNRFAVFGPGVYNFFSVDDFAETVCHYADQNQGQFGIDGPGSICQAQYPDPQPKTGLYLRQYSLLDDDPSTSAFESLTSDETNLRSEFNAVRLGFYAQDEWQVTDRFRLTFGLRADIPKILDDQQAHPSANSETLPDISTFYDLKGAEAGKMPDWRVFWSPRGGFNLALDEERTSQLRGGVGAYTSRLPFVWPGGAFLNDGVSSDFLVGGDFFFLPGQTPPLRRPQNALTRIEGNYKFFGGSNVSVDDIVPTGNLHLFREDFSYPRVLRTSLAYDQSLPYGWVGTVEGQYSSQLKDIIVRNVNLKTANATIQGATGDNRPIWRPSQYQDGSITVDGRYGDIFLFDNTDQGYTYNLTVRLQKQPTEIWDGGVVRGNVSYSYGDARSLNTYGGDTAGSLWDENDHVEGTNHLTLGRSPFSQGHRVQVSMAYRQDLSQNVAANLSLYYSGTSGRPFSYTIGGGPGGSANEDFIGDGGGSPLLYVPEDVSDLRLSPISFGGEVQRSVAQQRQDLRGFINNVDYLSENRGDYALRNADRTPFEGIVDLKFSLDFSGTLVGRDQRLSIMADVFNFSSLLGDIFGTDWGLRYQQAGSFPVLAFAGFEDSDGDGSPTPMYQSNLGTSDSDLIQSKEDIFQVESGTQTYSSLYQIQLGVKYTF